MNMFFTFAICINIDREIKYPISISRYTYRIVSVCVILEYHEICFVVFKANCFLTCKKVMTDIARKQKLTVAESSEIKLKIFGIRVQRNYGTEFVQLMILLIKSICV